LSGFNGVFDRHFLVGSARDAPRFSLSEEAAIHSDDQPTALSTVGSPNVVAAPMTSLWQQDLVAIRFVEFVTWAMARANRIASIASVTW
jgi:hypothetical protein